MWVKTNSTPVVHIKIAGFMDVHPPKNGINRYFYPYLNQKKTYHLMGRRGHLFFIPEFCYLGMTSLIRRAQGFEVMCFFSDTLWL